MTRLSRLVCVVVVLVAAAGARADVKLVVKSRVKLAAPSPLAQAVYLKPTGLELIAVGGFSPDNGRTWGPFTPKPDFDSRHPYGFRRERHPLFVDPSNGRVISVINSMDTPGTDPNEIEPDIALTTYYLRYRVSIDGGRTYLFDEPVVQSPRWKPAVRSHYGCHVIRRVRVRRLCRPGLRGAAPYD